MECGRIRSKPSGRKRSSFALSQLTIIMWGICCVCTLALTAAKTSSHYDRFAISVVFAPVRPRLARWKHKRPSRGRGALEEMGTNTRQVLYFSRKFYLRQFDLYPKNQNFDTSCFDPIQKFGMSTRGLTL